MALDKYDPDLIGDNHWLPDDYVQPLIDHIVGIKIPIESMQGKNKLGQHRSNQDQKNVYDYLSESPSDGAKALANYMKGIGVGIGDD